MFLTWYLESTFGSVTWPDMSIWIRRQPQNKMEKVTKSQWAGL